MTNPFLNFTTPEEQSLTLDLIEEAINIHGAEYYYIPRTLVFFDDILGEDRLSKFKNAYPITMYLETPTQLEGQGAFIERYGALLDYSATLTVSRRMWSKFVGQYGETMLPNRPCEGDLVYWPLTDQLYEIKYVNDKEPFAQLGAFYTYKLNISLFQYSSENIETGNEDIDAFEALKTFDQKNGKSYFKGVIKVNIENGGSGYFEEPTLEVQSRTGFGAVLKPNLDSNGSITSVDILDSGMNYELEDSDVTITGECETPAEISVECNTVLENVGDKWASNKSLTDGASAWVESFDPENPFGDM